jgi:hypothetical protein
MMNPRSPHNIFIHHLHTQQARGKQEITERKQIRKRKRESEVCGCVGVLVFILLRLYTL